jgi:ABC-type lipoprotein release transport system permease subunit
MIGLALVTFVAVLGSGMRSAFADALDEQLRGDYVVSVNRDADVPGLARSAGTAASRAAGVTLSSSVRSDNARIFGHDTGVVGVDPVTIARVYRFDFKRGSDRVLTGLTDGAIVDEGYAKKHHLGVGSPLTLQTSDGTRAAFTVRGIYKVGVEQLVSGVVIAQPAFDHAFPQPRDVYTFVKGDAGVGAALQRALADYPDAKVQSKAAFIKADQKDLDTSLMLFYVLLALSVVVSLFGMVNTMILSVFERTREIGMLRALGMSRRQARRMVRQESVITALIGAALGLPPGSCWRRSSPRASRARASGCTCRSRRSWRSPWSPRWPACSPRSHPRVARRASTSCARCSTSSGEPHPEPHRGPATAPGLAASRRRPATRGSCGQIGSRAPARRTAFWTLPVGVRGSSSRSSKVRGTLNAASRARQCSRSSSADGAAPGIARITACTSSPRTGSGTPMTAASRTPGCACRTSSTSRG